MTEGDFNDNINPTRDGGRRRRGEAAGAILFGKYRLERVIGTGRTGTVWLAVHMGLEEYRAIKCISRRAVDYETVRREALILKKLRHPAIPVVYDLEEDQEYLYLVEEYLQGSSLYTLIRKQGVIQEAEAVDYGIQLCQLVQFLHSVGENPILHLDLQPNNLIICKGVVKIVDFGQAVDEGCQKDEKRRCAVKGFASPEQYISDQNLDTRADLFAIGAVLSFMVYGTPESEETQTGEISQELKQIISRCMERDREKRFQTAGQVERRLAALSGPKKGKRNPLIQPSLVIAVAGSRPGAGATHLALALCACLSSMGTDALYVERNQSGHMRCLAQTLGIRPDRKGIYRIGGCKIRPWYGETAELEPERASVMVCDYGHDWKAMYGREKDILLMAAGSSPWERWDLERMLEQLGPEIGQGMGNFLIFRESPEPFFHYKLVKNRDKRIVRYRQPHYPDVFSPGKEGTEFLKELWRAVTRQEEAASRKERDKRLS